MASFVSRFQDWVGLSTFHILIFSVYGLTFDSSKIHHKAWNLSTVTSQHEKYHLFHRNTNLFSFFQPELAQVHLGFCNLSHETLEVTDEGKIINIRTSENMDDTVQNILTNEKSGLTHLDLMSTVVPFTIADATCDLSYHRNQMDENIQAFGQSGADNVENFKNKWLSEYHQLGEAAYK